MMLTLPLCDCVIMVLVMCSFDEVLIAVDIYHWHMSNQNE